MLLFVIVLVVPVGAVSLPSGEVGCVLLELKVGHVVHLVVEVVQLRPVVADVVAVLAIVKAVSLLHQAKVGGHAFSLILIHLVRLIAQLRDHVVETLHISLIGLLPNGLRVGVAVAAGECSRLCHRILHGKVALLGIAVFVLLIQRVGVEIVAEALAVEDFVQQRIDLLLILGLICTGLCRLDACQLILERGQLVRRCPRRSALLRCRKAGGSRRGRSAHRDAAPKAAADGAAAQQRIDRILIGLIGGLGVRAPLAVYTSGAKVRAKGLQRALHRIGVVRVFAFVVACHIASYSVAVIVRV